MFQFQCRWSRSMPFTLLIIVFFLHYYLVCSIRFCWLNSVYFVTFHWLLGVFSFCFAFNEKEKNNRNNKIWKAHEQLFPFLNDSMQQTAITTIPSQEKKKTKKLTKSIYIFFFGERDWSVSSLFIKYVLCNSWKNWIKKPVSFLFCCFFF